MAPSSLPLWHLASGMVFAVDRRTRCSHDTWRARWHRDSRRYRCSQRLLFVLCCAKLPLVRTPVLIELRLENYAVIDNLVVEFSQGLSLLTGETGAGKSILIDAL